MSMTIAAPTVKWGDGVKGGRLRDDLGGRGRGMERRRRRRG